MVGSRIPSTNAPATLFVCVSLCRYTNTFVRITAATRLLNAQYEKLHPLVENYKQRQEEAKLRAFRAAMKGLSTGRKGELRVKRSTPMPFLHANRQLTPLARTLHAPRC